MKCPLIALLTVSVTACTSPVERSDGSGESGLKVEPTGDGGTRYVVVRPGLLEVDKVAGGGFVGDDFVVPRAETLRENCPLATPWLRVRPGPAVVTAFPRVEVEWWGKLQPASATIEDAVDFELGIKHPDGKTSWVSSQVDTTLMRLERGAEQGDGWYEYHGLLDNPEKNGKEQAFGQVQVADGDEVCFYVCDVYRGVKLTVHALALESRPAPR
jgi:hypothetical protein